jgi:hypothetical protein
MRGAKVLGYGPLPCEETVEDLCGSDFLSFEERIEVR